MRYKFLIFIGAALMSANAVYSAVVDTIPEIIWEKKMLSIRGIFVGPNDEYVMTVGSNVNYLIFHNPENGEPTDTLTIDNGINKISQTTDGSMFAVNFNDYSKESIVIYDGYTKKIIKKLYDPNGYHFGTPVFSYNKKYLAVNSNGVGCTVWDIESNKIIMNVSYPERSGDTVDLLIQTTQFTPDNKYLIVEGLWRDSVTTPTGYVLPTHPIKKIFSVENNFDSVDTDVLSGVYSKTGKYCITYDADKDLLKVLDYNTKAQIGIIPYSGGTLNTDFMIDFTNDDKFLIIGNKTFNYEFYAYDLANLNEPFAYYKFTALMNTRISHDNSWIYADLNKKLVKLLPPWTKTGIEETESCNELIYPNPANNTFTIDLILSVSGNYKMQIADASGKTVQTSDLGYLESGRQSITGNLKEVAQGSYIVSVVGVNQIKSFKVVVE